MWNRVSLSWSLLVIIIFGPSIFPATANEMSAGNLQQICSSQDVDVDAPCRFYILGVVQGISVGMAMADGKVVTGRVCIPADVSIYKLEELVKAKLGADLMVYPKDKNIPAISLVGAIIGKTFPCNPSH